MLAPGAMLQDSGVSPLVRSTTRILQLNVGLYCNQVCHRRLCEAAALPADAACSCPCHTAWLAVEASTTPCTHMHSGPQTSLTPQACTHCHVESSPRRTETMDRATLTPLLTSMPRGVLAATAARSMSPVAKWQRQCSYLMVGDWVPLPHPGGPVRATAHEHQHR